MADVSVRRARPADAAAIAEVQVTAWREACAPLLPPGVLEQLDDARAERRWRDAAAAPPTGRHRLLVAVGDGRLVGFAAAGPGEDDDLDPATTAEILTLLVDPGSTGRGHGSRLLAATVEQLREAGFTTAVTWLFTADRAARAFFGSAGWAPDGATRTLDMGEPVPQLRLHVDIAG